MYYPEDIAGESRVQPAPTSLSREFATVAQLKAQTEEIKQKARLHVAQAEAARANGQSEVANAPLVRDLLRILREKEKEDEANEVELDEFKYIELLREHEYTRRVGELISFVASFASEDPHDLISPTAKLQVRTDPDIGKLRRKPWDFYVSDRLEAHATEVSAMIRERFPRRLGKAGTTHFIDTGDESVRVKFCRAVASMYRGSSVFSVRRYSTTKAITTLQSNISQHIRYFACVGFVDGELRATASRADPLPRDLYGI